MKTLFILVFLTSIPFAIPSFPGAEGWGAQTPGGRGGAVMIVTNTNFQGAGSLRDALRTPGPRIIVFRVSGPITVQDPQVDGYFGWYMNAENLSYVTVAGQTSPGGVTLQGKAGYGSSIITQYGDVQWHDGIFRFLRMRCRADNEEGTVSFYKAHDFILDHCDFSGGTDETTDMGYSHHYNLQWCTITNSQPSSGNWGGSIMWAAPNNYISIHHNLWAHHRDRSGPSINWYYDAPEYGMIDYVNNICYDFQLYSFRLKSGLTSGATEVRCNFVGNYFKGGPAFDAAYNHPNCEIGSTVNKYASDNVWQKLGSQPVALTASVNSRYGSDVSTRWDMPQVTTYSGAANFDSLLNKVGAWPRDAMNVRTIADVRNGTGVLRKIDDALITSGPAAPADADNDGMPDFWETGMGLNPNSAADNTADLDGDGYTNIEEYINDLANARMCEDYYNTVYPIPNDWPDYNPSCCKSLAVEEARLARQSNAGGLAVYPNPFAGSGIVRITPAGPDRDKGTVSIYDISGKTIAAFKASRPGARDGRDRCWREMAPGVYFIHWIVDGKMAGQRKFIVLK